MSDLVQQLREEAVRLSGHAIDRGIADAGIAANLADAAADRIESLEAAAKLREGAEPDDPYRNSEPGKAWNEAYSLRPPTEQTDARSGVREALEWAIAEIEGRTRYDSNDQFDNAMEVAKARLSALSPAAPDPTPVDDDISRVYEDHEPAAPEGQQEAVERLRRQVEAVHPNHKTMFVYVDDLRAALSRPTEAELIAEAERVGPLFVEDIQLLFAREAALAQEGK